MDDYRYNQMHHMHEEDEYMMDYMQQNGGGKIFGGRFYRWKKLSGAEKRKRRKAVLREQAATLGIAPPFGNAPAPSYSARGRPEWESQGDPKRFRTHSNDFGSGSTAAGGSVQQNPKPVVEEVHKVIIVHDKYPEDMITQEQLDQLRESLATGIDELPDFKGSFVPKLHTLLSQGGVVALCKDKETVSWLTAFISDVKCKPWPDASLKTIDVNEMPMKVLLWVPGCKVDNDLILKRIKKQNEGLDLSLWRVWERSEEDDGVCLELSIDKKSFHTITSWSGKLYCGAVKAAVSQPHPKPTDQ